MGKIFRISLLASVILFFSAWSEGEVSDIVGLWKLQIIEYKDSKTNEWHESEWMKGGTALLHYDSQGVMSVHFTPQKYEGVEMPNPYYMDSLTVEHLKVLSSDYWYVAKYEVKEEEGLIEHHRIMHSDPNEWNKEVNRYYEIKGDTLILTPEEFNLRLIWVKT